MDKYVKLAVLARSVHVAAEMRLSDGTIRQIANDIMALANEKPVIDVECVAVDNRKVNYAEQAERLQVKLVGASCHKSVSAARPICSGFE